MTNTVWRDIFDTVEDGVRALLEADKSGHGFDHIERVRDLSRDFAAHYPEADHKIVELAALLHDVDDYKLVGVKNASKQLHATRIMADANVPLAARREVLDITAQIGYKKALQGGRPATLEGQIVSDADMCDASGASGIVRALMYAVSDKGTGRVFDKEVKPNMNITANEYNEPVHDSTDGFINYFFEKMLKLQGMMLTEPGRKEAAEREVVMVQFLRAYFREQNALEWSDMLDLYLIQREGMA